MTHWDEYTFDRKLRAFEAIGFAQGEAVKLADIPWDNFTGEVKRALKESDDTFFGTGIDGDKEYTEEEIEAENKKKEETGESYDYNNIGANELQRTKYQCEYCNCGYKSNESLSVHLNDVHTVTLGEIGGYGLNATESSYYKRAKESDERCSNCGDLEDLDEYGKCSYCHEEAKEVKIQQGDLYQGGQKVGTIRDYNSKQHEGYVTLEGIGIEEFGAMTSDYEVRVNGERIPNKWDGKHDYNLDLFGEAESPSAIGEDSETVDVFDLVHETKTDEEREADAMAYDALEEQGQSGNPYNIFDKKKSSESRKAKESVNSEKYWEWAGQHSWVGSAPYYDAPENRSSWMSFALTNGISDSEATSTYNWYDLSPNSSHNVGESFAKEDDPDFENDPDFEGKIGGKIVEPSQYTQSGMDHEDRSRGDIDFDGETRRRASEEEVPTSMSEEDRARLELRNQDADEDSYFKNTKTYQDEQPDPRHVSEESERDFDFDEKNGLTDDDYKKEEEQRNYEEDEEGDDELRSEAKWEAEEAVRSCPACNYENDGRSLSCTSCGQDFPSSEEPSVQAQETITTAFGNGMVYHTSTAGGTIEHAEDEWCTSCDNINESKAKAKEYNVWGSDAESFWNYSSSQEMAENFELYNSERGGIGNMPSINLEWTSLSDGQKSDISTIYQWLSTEEDNDFYDQENYVAKELFGQNDPDEILGGSWGTPENTAQDLYNSMPHNYPEEDYSKYESMIISKMGSASTGQFSANALDLFLRNKGATSDDLINDLVMEYGRGTDPIW